jgi:hypothetical protein
MEQPFLKSQQLFEHKNTFYSETSGAQKSNHVYHLLFLSTLAKINVSREIG